ncbi:MULTISPECIES: sulfite exporter TauE/SafE family protein [Leucobacter]|uniref:Probable membrane transporter protein n=1 Tax=Leucobacter chromiireducens subsp. chromiireducens TaxID=660067 RepID=A0ABS1SQT9_9MICO|nr:MULTISPECIES: sulfite exporter TauE/SafE family protein [Leucobacter]MBL3690310.1 sulfite exporter TauE/SafE family protein [Leucobacter chromiireducens subsp. chromiireducens]
MTQTPRSSFIVLALLGALTGLLSGVFGIGGGVVLVPMLVMFLGFQQRLAAGTSVAAILPAAVVGGIGYAVQGNVDWITAIALAAGVIVGAQIGSYLLSRVPTGFLRWLFMGFLAAVVVSLWFVVPQRDAEIEKSTLIIVLLVVTGLVTGVLSGLLGVGGGVVVVPVLMFFFGASDLIAKGTSLIMLIPGSISGTIGNARRRNVDLRAAAILGIAASVLSPLGSVIATHIPPFWSNVAFSLLLAFVLGQMLWKTIKK